MPGPGLDLVGEGELAEVVDVIRQPAHYKIGRLPSTDALPVRSMSFGIGVTDPNLAPFGRRMRDNAEVARRRAERFITTHREIVV